MITGEDVKKIINLLNKYKKEKRSIEIVISNDIGCVNLFFYNGNYKIKYYACLNELIISQLEEEQNKRGGLIDIDFSNIVDCSLIENITKNNSKDFVLKLFDRKGRVSIEITSVIGM
jgi:hypothetical protein